MDVVEEHMDHHSTQDGEEAPECSLLIAEPLLDTAG